MWRMRTRTRTRPRPRSRPGTWSRVICWRRSWRPSSPWGTTAGPWPRPRAWSAVATSVWRRVRPWPESHVIRLHHYCEHLLSATGSLSTFSSLDWPVKEQKNYSIAHSSHVNDVTLLYAHLSILNLNVEEVDKLPEKHSTCFVVWMTITLTLNYNVVTTKFITNPSTVWI